MSKYDPTEGHRRFIPGDWVWVSPWPTDDGAYLSGVAAVVTRDRHGAYTVWNIEHGRVKVTESFMARRAERQSWEQHR